MFTNWQISSVFVSYKLHGIVTACVVIVIVNKSVHDEVQVDIKTSCYCIRIAGSQVYFSVSVIT